MRDSGNLAFLLLLCKLPVLPLHKNIHPLIEIRELAAGDYNFLVFGGLISQNSQTYGHLKSLGCDFLFACLGLSILLSGTFFSLGSFPFSTLKHLPLWGFLLALTPTFNHCSAISLLGCNWTRAGWSHLFLLCRLLLFNSVMEPSQHQILIHEEMVATSGRHWIGRPAGQHHTGHTHSLAELKMKPMAWR